MYANPTATTENPPQGDSRDRDANRRQDEMERTQRAILEQLQKLIRQRGLSHTWDEMPQ